MQSQRKAPANTALGFRREVQKLTVLVQLLMGEVPDRSAFEGPGMEAALAPYLVLARAVRRGDLPAYPRPRRNLPSSAEDPRRGRGAAATRLHGRSTS